MTDRVRHLTVALDKEYRTDDVEVIVEAIKMIKCVQDVALGEPQSMDDYMSMNAYRREAYDSLLNVIHLAAYKPEKFKAIALQAKLAKEES